MVAILELTTIVCYGPIFFLGGGGTIRYVIKRSMSYSPPNFVLVSRRGTHFDLTNPTIALNVQSNFLKLHVPFLA